MKDTAFALMPAQLARLAQMYGPDANDTLEEKENILIPGDVTSTKRTPFPGGGLFSTAMDMFRFYQMIANGGTFDGRRYLSEKMVGEMTRTQTGHLQDAGMGAGMTYGLGINVLRDPQAETAILSPGSYGHDGASGTSAFVDPSRKLLMIHMLQRTALWGEPHEGRVMRQAFQEAVIAAVGE